MKQGPTTYIWIWGILSLVIKQASNQVRDGLGLGFECYLAGKLLQNIGNLITNKASKIYNRKLNFLNAKIFKKLIYVARKIITSVGAQYLVQDFGIPNIIFS